MEIAINEKMQNTLPPADWAGEIERLQDDLRAERDKTLRTLADFKNFRRNIEREGNKLAVVGKREIILPILDIVDDIENTLQWVNDNEQSAVQCVRIIHQKCLALLKAHGVLAFDSIGTAFDHNLHEAIALAKEEGSVPGTVVNELRRGYRWNNELLRAAQVRVAG